MPSYKVTMSIEVDALTPEAARDRGWNLIADEPCATVERVVEVRDPDPHRYERMTYEPATGETYEQYPEG